MTTPEPTGGERGPLGVLGLGPAAELLYGLLVDRAPATVDDLTAGWARSEPLPDVLAVLEQVGLATRLSGEPVRYLAEPPQVALEPMLANRERRLREARASVPTLMATYRQHTAESRPPRVLEVVSGRAAVWQRFVHLHTSAQSQVRWLAGPSFLGDPGNTDNPGGSGDRVTGAGDLGDLVGRVVALPRGRARRRVLYDSAAVRARAAAGAEPLSMRTDSSGVEVTARVVDEVPVTLLLCDDRLALVPLASGPEETAVVVHPSTLLDALGLLFEGAWVSAVPVAVAEAATDRPPQRGTRGLTLSEADRRTLVELLLSGVTHTAAARQLGTSYRTVERRIAALLDEFGARTMFQAGARAALHGYRASDTDCSHHGDHPQNTAE